MRKTHIPRCHNLESIPAEVKHLSKQRKINQRDSPTSGERTGKSPNCQCEALTAEERRIDAECRRRNAFVFFPRGSAFSPRFPRSTLRVDRVIR